MSIRLGPEDRDALRRYVERKWKPTNRQKALALLDLSEGESLERVSVKSGIKKDELTDLIARFSREGLTGIGITVPGAAKEPKPRRSRYTSIIRTRGVCGGAARVAGTRVPVWQLVEARHLGTSEAQLLLDFPSLTALSLVEAWKYALDHPEEIATRIHENAGV